MAPLPEQVRLDRSRRREENWKRWGPYLSERQWGTVREDYSERGDSWSSFTHDEARSRAYRWGEDGLLGFTDRQGRLCFAWALWNEADPILKERLFGLTGPEGNHGEDVKEVYHYVDSTPTHSFMRALYRYPHAAFPYEALVNENTRRGKGEREHELIDTGVFEDNRFFDVTATYAKASPNDILIRLTVKNHGPSAPLHILPTLWFRNTWSPGRSGEGYGPKPRISRLNSSQVAADHASLGRFVLSAATRPWRPALLFTENETNTERLYGTKNVTPYTKDAFHEYVVSGAIGRVHPAQIGTKFAAYYHVPIIATGAQIEIDLRLTESHALSDDPLGDEFEAILASRAEEADAFYDAVIPERVEGDARRVTREGYAGLMWTKQFYYYSVEEWLEGDPAHAPPPPARRKGRNREWSHLYNRDVISMPDKWEYPWYAAWDLAFHMIPFCRVDPDFAKAQLILLLREWYMHPNGQMPAYEFNFSDVNPPVHAWAAWRVYQLSSGAKDTAFLARVFHKLLLNFTWWVNRKDEDGNNVFSGGFLGLDNIGVFDRSKPLPTGGLLRQADGTAWMAFYCTTMLNIALELARTAPEYEDVASKFFEHFVAITDAMNTLGGTGLWDERDGFYYDVLALNGRSLPLKIRSMVGLIPLFVAGILEDDLIDRLPGFKKRMRWFLEHRPHLARHLVHRQPSEEKSGAYLLSIASRTRLTRILSRVLSETEFLSPYGVRSMSRAHLDDPFVLNLGGQRHEVRYVSGESDSYLFGGNSNWRGPIWFPVNFLLIEALERYHAFYGDTFAVECPSGSGQFMTLAQVAAELSRRLTRLFLPDGGGHKAYHGGDPRQAAAPWSLHELFYEYFDGDTGRGLGASHQTGWTALVVTLLEQLAVLSSS